MEKLGVGGMSVRYKVHGFEENSTGRKVLQINRLVYKLHDLTKGEIKIVEESL